MNSAELTLYQHMYAILCGAASRAIEELEPGCSAKTATRLQPALQQAEEGYRTAK